MTKNQKNLNDAETTTFYVLALQDTFANSYCLGRLLEIRGQGKNPALRFYLVASSFEFCNSVLQQRSATVRRQLPAKKSRSTCNQGLRQMRDYLV